MKTLHLMLPLLLCATVATAGGPKANYIGVRGGAYAPMSNEMDRFSTGFSGELCAGSRVHRHVATEIGVGLESSQGPSGEIIGRISGAMWTGTFDVSVVPVTVAVLGVLPLGRGEVYAGLGGAAYFSSIKAVMGAEGRPTQEVRAGDTPFGMLARAGGRYDVAGGFVLDGQLQWDRATATFTKTIGTFEYSRDFALDGVTARAGILYRF